MINLQTLLDSLNRSDSLTAFWLGDNRRVIITVKELQFLKQLVAERLDDEESAKKSIDEAGAETPMAKAASKKRESMSKGQF